MIFVTKRLRLVLLAAEDLLALITGPDAFAVSFGWPAAEGLRDFLTGDELSSMWLARLRRATGKDPWKHGFALLHPKSGSVIGFGGFKGPPGKQGVVELAYGVVPGYQGKGLATEAASALVSYAFRSGRVRVIRAHTVPEPNPSTRVLAKCGFRLIGEVKDPDEGLAWRWERPFVTQT
jgi:RimJ/RimL family protein N-acetyltransferase